MEEIRLSERKAIEKQHSTNLKSYFLNKGWTYNVYNNEFIKDSIIAYFYLNTIIFYFDINVASKQQKNRHHKIEL